MSNNTFFLHLTTTAFKMGCGTSYIPTFVTTFIRENAVATETRSTHTNFLLMKSVDENLAAHMEKLSDVVDEYSKNMEELQKNVFEAYEANDRDKAMKNFADWKMLSNARKRALKQHSALYSSKVGMKNKFTASLYFNFIKTANEIASNTHGNGKRNVEEEIETMEERALDNTDTMLMYDEIMKKQKYMEDQIDKDSSLVNDPDEDEDTALAEFIKAKSVGGAPKPPNTMPLMGERGAGYLDNKLHNRATVVGIKQPKQNAFYEESV